MNVRLEVLFDKETPDPEKDLRSVAFGLTDDGESVRVFPNEGKPGWIVAEFTMPRQRQIDAVDCIDGSLDFQMLNRLNSTISFPKHRSKPTGTE